MMNELDEVVYGVDPVLFAEEALNLVLDGWQRDYLASTVDRTLINASRQSGKSTITAVRALHRALFFKDSLVLVLAPALRQSQELFVKLTDFYSYLGEPKKMYGERRLSLELSNGSRVVSLPGSEKTIRGYSGAALLLVDEAARVDNSLYFAIRPMLAVSGGKLVMLSTPAGKRGVFYEAWEDGMNHWERYEVPADQCPRIPKAFLEAEKRALPAPIFRQEYYCRFEDLEDALFRAEDIEKAFTSEVPPLYLKGGL